MTVKGICPVCKTEQWIYEVGKSNFGGYPKSTSIRVIEHEHDGKTCEGSHLVPEKLINHLKDGACTIQITGSANMSQAELDYYGKIIARAPVRAKGFKEAAA